MHYCQVKTLTSVLPKDPTASILSNGLGAVRYGDGSCIVGFAISVNLWQDGSISESASRSQDDWVEK